MGFARRAARRRTIVGAAATVSMVSGARRNRAERHALENANEQYDQTQAAQPAQGADPTEEIMKYKALLDKGVLSQEEFEAKKKEILGL